MAFVTTEPKAYVLLPSSHEGLLPLPTLDQDIDGTNNVNVDKLPNTSLVPKEFTICLVDRVLHFGQKLLRDLQCSR